MLINLVLQHLLKIKTLHPVKRVTIIVELVMEQGGCLKSFFELSLTDVYSELRGEISTLYLYCLIFFFYLLLLFLLFYFYYLFLFFKTEQVVHGNS